jgi:hypothetical protein
MSENQWFFTKTDDDYRPACTGRAAGESRWSSEVSCFEPPAKRRKTSGDPSAVAPPVPIPNTEVKRCSPDDSTSIGCAKVGRRQSYAPSLAKAGGGASLCPDGAWEGWREGVFDPSSTVRKLGTLRLRLLRMGGGALALHSRPSRRRRDLSSLDFPHRRRHRGTRRPDRLRCMPDDLAAHVVAFVV